jgi:hypothetical protein
MPGTNSSLSKIPLALYLLAVAPARNVTERAFVSFAVIIDGFDVQTIAFVGLREWAGVVAASLTCAATRRQPANRCSCTPTSFPDSGSKNHWHGIQLQSTARKVSRIRDTLFSGVTGRDVDADSSAECSVYKSSTSRSE